MDGNIITEEVAKSYADVAHKLRLTPDQASGILEYYKGIASETSEMSIEAENQQRASVEMELRKAWGDDFEARIEDAGKVAKQFGGNEILEMKLADGTKVGNHPDFIKAFAKMAEFRQSVTSEDTVSDAPTSSMMTRQSAQQEIDAIMNDKSHVYWDRKNVIGRQAAIERVQELMGVLHGTG